jgi:regulator of RNase E activity RraA
VVVLDNGGRTDCTVWGDILTTVAHHQGVAGTVIDGVCRDVHRALSVGYPVYSRGRFMRTGKDRVEVAEVGGSVSLGDVQVHADDLVIGDDDGIVVVAQDAAGRVLEVAREISERESKIVESVLAGDSLSEARARYGYHQLPRAPS